MTRTLYRRDSKFMRFVSTIVAMTFMLSLAGSGFATPPAPDASETAADMAAVETSQTAGEVEAPAAAEVPPPTEDEPEPPAEAPLAVTEPGEEPAAETPAPKKPAKDAETDGADTLVAAAAIEPALAEPGTGIKVNFFEGYNRFSGWTTGNLGKNYEEGDYVAYRLVLQNTGSDEASPLDLIFGLDHFNSNANAIMFESTRDWGYKIVPSAPSSNDPYDPPAGLIPLSPSPKDVANQGSSEVIESTIPSGSFTIPAGSYAIVYFQAELAMTLKWMPLQGSYGAGGYPGSSGQGYLLMGGGKKTVPLPSVVVPGGDISVFKFYDTDMDGNKDANETTFLSGWEIHLADGAPIGTITTDANGKALFDYLPAGTYYVSETLKDGWDSETVQPIEVVVGKGESKTVYIGNFELEPELTLVKSASPSIYDEVGDVIEYSYLVTNTGNVTLSAPWAVLDDKTTVGVSGAPATLAPGASFTVTAEYVITQADIDAGSVTNTAHATGTFDGDTVTSNEDSETVTSQQSPALTLLKEASPSTYDSVGDEISYSYTLTNSGNVTLYGPFTVDDDKATVTPVGMAPMVLAPGASIMFEATYVITQADLDAGSVTNTAQGHGYFGDVPVHSNYDDETVTAVQMPAILLDKSVSPEIVLSGETVTYTYVVTNTGNQTLTDVVVTDDKLGSIGSVETLAPGESVTFTVTAAIVADTTNVGTAVGNPPGENTVSDDDAADVDVVNPQIMVEKTPATSEILTGETVIYTYKVTNTGDVDLKDVVLTDDKLGVVGTLDSLAVGESKEFTASAQLSEPTTNVVVATAEDVYGHQVSDEATAFVDVGLPFSPPDLTIEKTADKSEAEAGDTVVYTLTYRNLGPGVASDITIVDDFDERYVKVTDAAGGTIEDGKITWTIEGPLSVEDGPQEIEYTVKINSDLPEDVKVVRNTVVISTPDEENTDNNTDTWEVDINEPFLPFTGGQLLLMAFITGFAVLIGTGLRRYGRPAVSEL